MTQPDNGRQRGGGVRHTLRSLRSRNYRLYFSGQAVSLIGTWMQQIALSWLVYRLTDSAFYLGLVGFANQLPMLLLSPFAGVMVDRFDRHRILVGTQALSMLQASTLAALTLTGVVELWHVLALSAFMGLVFACDMPARQAFVVEMVEDRDDLPNAIALNSSLFNGARLVGPSVAGVLIATVGEGMCFLLNAVSYLAVLAALLAMRIPRLDAPARNAAVLDRLKEGFRYAWGFLPIRAVLLLMALMSLVGMPYTVLMPVYADEVLGGGAKTLGFLVAASGLGAMAGALYLASRRTVLGLGNKIVGGTVLFGLGLILVSLSRHLWLSLPLMAISGFGMMVQMAASNTIVQTIVDDDKRGRVMSLYGLAFAGTAPIGSLVAGSLATRIGVPYTLLGGGALCIVGGILFFLRLPALREVARPTYVRLGILPPAITPGVVTTEGAAREP